jgi:hypothetical protein
MGQPYYPHGSRDLLLLLVYGALPPSLIDIAQCQQWKIPFELLAHQAHTTTIVRWFVNIRRYLLSLLSGIRG